MTSLSTKKYNIVNFGFNAWSNYWKRNQTIVTFLSNLDCVERVLFVNPEIWITDILRLPKCTDSHLQWVRWKGIIPRRVSQNIYSYTPTHIPFENRSPVSKMVFQSFFKRIVAQFLNHPIILILNNPQKTTNELVSLMTNHSDFTIFDWSDDFEQFGSSTEERCRTKVLCNSYCRLADVVITVNKTLEERARRINPQSFTIRNGTGFFTVPNCTPTERSFLDLSRLSSPVIGYVGWLNSRRLDTTLLDYLCRARPHWNFVFIGPTVEPFPLGQEVIRHPNVHLLPPVSYEAYPACLRALDVCILPNNVNAYTNGNDPIKIYDYLASGNPIVSTPTAGTEEFKDLIRCADSKEAFLAMIDAAIKEDCLETRRQRENAARGHSWEVRFQELMMTLNPLLETRRKRRA